MATADLTTTPSLSFVRTLRSAPDRVWRAWTDPEAMKRWFAPSDAFTVPVVEADVRLGGRYRIVMKSPDGEERDVRGVYREIVPNEKLVFTWAWQSTPERESLVTLRLRPAGSGTELTLTHEQLHDTESLDVHRRGWVGVIGQLAAFVG